MLRPSVVSLGVILVLGGFSPTRGQGGDLNDLLEKAVKQAAQKVAPSVVQITTLGGADIVVTGAKGTTFRKALGPTTGVVVSEDGYIVSSAFNFINNPTNILVTVQGHKDPYVAERIATDKARMITLIKIPAKNLPVPQVVPRNEIQVGHWAIALGRTLDSKRDAPPSISVGIISAVGRIWSRALQTDAKVSPINYGGPIVDITGRVQGILVPASPRGEDETAGFEWYDSGIGFAIPMEDIQRALPRLKGGADLKKAQLGITLKSQDLYSAIPEIGGVAKDSGAARAGLKPGDVILEIDGHPVVRMAQVLHLLGPKYEGDTISLKYKRGMEVIEVPKLELSGAAKIYAHPFLGILPLRDDPKLGVQIRHVYPKSPAEKAGLKPGDRIVKFGGAAAKEPTGFSGLKRGRSQFFDFLNTQSPGSEITLEVRRQDGKTETVKAVLEGFPGAAMGQDDAIPAKLPLPASLHKALEPLETTNPKVKPVKPEPGKAQTGLLKRTNSAGDQNYWIYVPENYDANISYALVAWLHPPGKYKDDDTAIFIKLWADFCKENHIILVGPLTEAESGWVRGDTDFVVEAIRGTMNQYTIDEHRVVAHGMGVGGEMAIYLGFKARDLIRGAAALGAIPSYLKDNQANQRLAFFLACGDLDPLAMAMPQGRQSLWERKLPLVYKQIANLGRDYFDGESIRDLVHWIDALDRQ